MVVLTAHRIPSSHQHHWAVTAQKLSLFYFLIYAGEAWVSQYTISFFISFQLVHNGSLIQQERKRGRRSVREERLGRCGDGDGNNEITQCWWTTLHYTTLHWTTHTLILLLTLYWKCLWDSLESSGIIGGASGEDCLYLFIIQSPRCCLSKQRHQECPVSGLQKDQENFVENCKLQVRTWKEC